MSSSVNGKTTQKAVVCHGAVDLRIVSRPLYIPRQPNPTPSSSLVPLVPLHINILSHTYSLDTGSGSLPSLVYVWGREAHTGIIGGSTFACT